MKELMCDVYILKNYGKITLRVDCIMDIRKITINQMARATGLRYEVISRYYHGCLERLDMDVLAKICYALDCELSEIVKYENE